MHSTGHSNITKVSRLQSWQDVLAKLRIKTRRKHDFTILSDLSGTIPPGRICLLLGPPGSGKTSLLEALAGKLSEGGARKVLPRMHASVENCRHEAGLLDSISYS